MSAPKPQAETSEYEEAREAHKATLSQSMEASVGFHEKLAVLTAGSVALAVSGAGVLYQKPLANPLAMCWLLYSLAFSSVCLWLSLLTSLCHNIVAAYALHFESSCTFYQAGLHAVSLIAKMDKEGKIGGNVKDLSEEEVSRVSNFIGDQVIEGMVRARNVRDWGMPLSVIAVSLFDLGYLSVVAYVVVLAIMH